jgi:predicted RecA/RadA family phage recombinase
MKRMISNNSNSARLVYSKGQILSQERVLFPDLDVSLVEIRDSHTGAICRSGHFEIPKGSLEAGAYQLLLPDNEVAEIVVTRSVVIGETLTVAFWTVGEVQNFRARHPTQQR